MMEHVFINHDDSDGNVLEGLHLSVGDDGDFFVGTDSSEKDLRFRMPLIGGGNNPKTWFAFRHLFKAINEDNQSNELKNKQFEFEFENSITNIHSMKNMQAKYEIDKLVNLIQHSDINSDLIIEEIKKIQNIL